MSISTRFTRAAIAFLVFGLFAAMLPSNGSALADTAACPPLSTGSSGNLDNNVPTAGWVVMGAAGAGLIYVLVAPSRKHGDNTTTTSSAGFKQVASTYSGVQGYLYNSH
jgi:hypothetical protein